MLQVTSYTIITQIYSTEIAKYLTYIEIVVGLGIGLGPTIGSFVYKYLDYSGTMYFFAGLNLLGVLMCYVFLPSELNKTMTSQEIEEIEAE